MSEFSGLGTSKSRSWDQANDSLLLGDEGDSFRSGVASSPPRTSTPPAQPPKAEAAGQKQGAGKGSSTDVDEAIVKLKMISMLEAHRHDEGLDLLYRHVDEADHVLTSDEDSDSAHDDDDAEPATLSMAPKMLSREQSGGNSGHFFQPGRTGSSDALLFVSSAAGVNRTGSGSLEGNAAQQASDDPLVHYPFKRKHTILETVQDDLDDDGSGEEEGEGIGGAGGSSIVALADQIFTSSHRAPSSSGSHVASSVASSGGDDVASTKVDLRCVDSTGVEDDENREVGGKERLGSGLGQRHGLVFGGAGGEAAAVWSEAGVNVGVGGVDCEVDSGRGSHDYDDDTASIQSGVVSPNSKSGVGVGQLASPPVKSPSNIRRSSKTKMTDPIAIEANGVAPARMEGGGASSYSDSIIVTQPFTHQAGGARVLRTVKLRAVKGSLVAKPCCKREAWFYRNGGALKKYAPRFHGIKPCDKGVPSVLLEDLTSGYRNPCVMDVKIGVCTAAPDRTAVKQARCKVKDARTTTGSVGARICGMRVYRIDTGDFKMWDKHWGNKLLFDEFGGGVLNFFDNGTRVRRKLATRFVECLQGIRKMMAEQSMYRFYASSILFIYEGDEEGVADGEEIDAACTLNVKMIDFAHVFPIGEGHGSRDDSYREGLDNLLRVLTCIGEGAPIHEIKDKLIDHTDNEALHVHSLCAADPVKPDWNYLSASGSRSHARSGVQTPVVPTAPTLGSHSVQREPNIPAHTFTPNPSPVHAPSPNEEEDLPGDEEIFTLTS